MTPHTGLTTLTGTQAGGAVTVELPSPPVSGQIYAHAGLFRHTVAVESFNTATGALIGATAGTLTISGRVKGITRYDDLGSVSLSSPSPVSFEGFFSSFSVVSVGFDADKTWRLSIASGN